MAGPTTPRLFGISNCDTVKKARAWFQAQGREVQFHDFKKQGVPEDRLDAWLAVAGWERVLNRQGTTWRQLEEATRAEVTDAPSARRVLLELSSAIKRPVVEWPGGAVTVGFDAADWARRLADGVNS